MRHRWMVAAAAVCALAVVFWAYSNFFENAFHFDDSHAIVENAAIRSLSNTTRFFTDANTFSSLPANATYRPLVTLSFALDYARAGGLAPRPYHVTQLLLLLIVATLLGVFAYELLDDALLATGAAALFAVHTANTETLNFLSSRSELLSAVGFMIAAIAFVAWPRWRRMHLYLIPLVIGALAKAPVVIFALVVVAWVRIVERRSWREALREAAPSFVAGVVVLIALSRMNSPQWTPGGGSRWEYLLTQPFVWMHYVRLALLPVGLTPDTDLRAFTHWYDTRALAGIAFVALLFYAMRRLSRREDTAPIAFGIAWFAITLLPTSSFFPLAEVANEHRLFFPLMGFAIAVAGVVRVAPPRLRTATAVVLVFAIAANAIGTHERNTIWKTEESLWRDVTEKSPMNGRAWMNYGLTQMEAGKLEDARTLFARAAQLTPGYSILEVNQGIVSGALGDKAEAERHFLRALQLSPDRSSHFYYARWLAANGRAPEAEGHLREAATLAPSWVEPRALSMRLAVARGADADARAAAADILSIDPSSAEASMLQRSGTLVTCAAYEPCFANGLSLTNRRQDVDAALWYRAALRHRRTADAFNNLGWSLASMGYRSEAAAAYREALAIDPAFERARNNLLLLQR